MKNIISLLACTLILCNLMSQNRTIDWVNTFGGDDFDRYHDIVVDDYGNAYVVGTFRDTVDMNPTGINRVLISNGNTDLFLAKYSVNGNLYWVHQIGGAGNDTEITIEIDHSGNLIVAGKFQDSIDVDLGNNDYILNNVGTSNCFLAKYDTSAALIWAKQFKSAVPEGNGRFPKLRVFDMKIDFQNNIYISGGFNDSIDFNPDTGLAILYSNSFENAFIAKLDSNGSYIWAKHITSNSHLFANQLALDDSSNVYCSFENAGLTDFDPGVGIQNRMPTEGYSSTLLKLNPNGDFLWVKVIDGNTISDFSAIEDIEFSNNELYVVGIFTGTLDLDPGPNSAMHTATNTNINESSVFILNLNASGSLNFVKAIHPKPNKYIRALSVVKDNANGFFIFGAFNDSIDLDFGSGVSLHSSFPNRRTVYLSHIDSASNLIQANIIGWGPNTPALVVDDSNNVYAAGHFVDSSYFQLPSTKNNLETIGRTDGIMFKLSNTITALKEHVFEKKNAVALYPNPTKNKIHIIMDDFKKVEIFNLNGQLIHTSYSNEISVEAFKIGLYLLKVYSSDSIQTIDFIRN